jgi:hypothetical protein
VRDRLGHASILTTERYDNQRLEALQAAVERLEGGKTFDPQTEAAHNLSAEAVSLASAKAELSRIFQDPTEPHFADGKAPQRPPLQVTDSVRDGELVPVRGYRKECSAGNVEFVGIAA